MLSQSVLKMEAVPSFKKSLNTYHSTQRCVPEDSNLYMNYSLLFLFYFSLALGGYFSLVSKENVNDFSENTCLTAVACTKTQVPIEY